MSSALRSSASPDPLVRLISPRQAAAGTFLGGPVAYIYFIWANYLAIGKPALARKSLKFGALLLLAWNIAIALDVLTPKPLSIAFDFVLKVAPLLLVIFARQRVQKQFESLPRQYDFCSNWRVAGNALLCLLASVGCLLPAVAIVIAVALGTSGFR